MRHIGRFGRVDEKFSVWADRHAFRLDADLNVARACALFNIDDGDGVVVLVGDVENLASLVLDKEFRIGPRGQGVCHLLSGGIDHLDGVIVADRNQHEFAVLREFDAAWTLADFDGFDNGPLIGIDHRNSVALFIRHIGDEGADGQGASEPDGNSGN